ncbi:hypothetical protein INS49_004612 [Diaporthe citri]|uniref:uncharacterized protein n=1 Tax=Diaporthe citri TaxID=83186 RepID=UPI001C7EC2CF|nr:uncharacterized protein INS49_004612 [Diaporthe citri]KAG6354594.1 hypothetical protein INS49_004612 [Diaporthe citri]
MKHPAFLQIAILALLGLASAMSLIFFGAGDNCWIGVTDHIGCYDIGENHCCHSADPFCVTALLADSDMITHTTYFTNGSNCVVHTDLSFCDRCITSDACCLYLPVAQDNSKCSAYWHYGEPSPDPNHPDVQVMTEKPCIQPNFLVYNDGLTPRRILIPNGKLDDVMDKYSRRDFGALSRYETLGGDGG